jgi:TetR/AcrR family transcriptional regulator, tetracycline repressor protein
MARRAASDTTALKLDRGMIVRAALELIDRDGFDAFSVRELAKHLGVGNMSLYWHIEDRETLLALVLDEVLATVDLSSLPPEPLDAVEVIAARFVEAFKRHPQTVPLVALTPIVSIGPGGARVFGKLIQSLLDSGLDHSAMAATTIVLFEYLSGHLVGYLTDLRSPSAHLHDSVQRIFAGFASENLPELASIERAFLAVSTQNTDLPGVKLILASLRRPA